ncbi:MAG: ribosome silencing factor [Chitinophagales bacterium]|nr:ribosome silencing factor [Chitinophagales bacterium]
MKIKKTKPPSQTLSQSNVEVIIHSIQEKKGENIISIDLRNIPDAVTDFFIICDAESTTQVKAIAGNVMEKTKIILSENPWHVEGLQHAEWILLDYVDTVVHIFLRPLRKFYQLEELWSDAIIEEHND